jgi:hypothetical protein
MFKDKEFGYEVDQVSWRIFNIKNSNELNSCIVK